MAQHDSVAIVGGGLIGLATAYALTQQRPSATITLLEAETGLAQHQSGRNSGVLHSGIYYQPGSLKARLCRDGATRLIEFCETHEIPLDRCGKVIVATRDSELGKLNDLYERGNANGLIGLELLEPGALREIEPHVAARGAVAVPEAGVVDFGRVATTLSDLITQQGHQVRTGFRVAAIDRRNGVFRLRAESGDYVEANSLINCAGLHSDRVARMAGANPPVQIIPFRGEYFMMPADRDYLVRHLVYPVPDPRFPFLGVHFTRRIDESVEVGPNAVLALGRHHYRGEGGASWADTKEMLTSPGLWRLARKYWRTGTAEMVRSSSRRLYAAAARKLIPAIESNDLIRGGSGIRAQAVARDGALADDFVIVETEGAVHVLNAPSPAATASLAIGERIAQRLVANRG
ncbi:MAG: L-2-hydroxyglutarate oxidase [Acidimicrobiia bacterium]|nr:L-2-hydroxyglutarate oxidase [Acidimicrobiia bacterium]